MTDSRRGVSRFAVKLWALLCLALILITASATAQKAKDKRAKSAVNGEGVLATAPAQDPDPQPNRIWNPLPISPDNQPQIVKVLVLNYDPIVPEEGHRRLSRVFNWAEPPHLAAKYTATMEHASGGYLKFEIVEWRNINEIYAQTDGKRYTVEEYVRNRRSNSGWRENVNADYPRLLREQNVVPLIDDGVVDEVWVFSDHYFGLWEASMAGPRAFFINGGVYPDVPSKRPFAVYGFNYERAAAEMAHNTSHRTESTMNRIYGEWNLKSPTNNWERFSANHDQSDGLAGIGTCHWPANAKSDYDYSNEREVASWADDFLDYPRLDGTRKLVSKQTWSDGQDDHLSYMHWYFAHLPRAVGENKDGRQNNWWKYLYDFDNYTDKGKPKPAWATLHASDLHHLGDGDHVIQVLYSSPVGIDTSTFDSKDITISGPNGYSRPAEFIGTSDKRNGTLRVGSYRVRPRSRIWGKSDRGMYTVRLQQGVVKDALGKPLDGGELGSFQVGSVGAVSGRANKKNSAPMSLRLEPAELKLRVTDFKSLAHSWNSRMALPTT